MPRAVVLLIHRYGRTNFHISQRKRGAPTPYFAFRGGFYGRNNGAEIKGMAMTCVRMCARVLYGSENKQRLFLYTSLTDRCIYIAHTVVLFQSLVGVHSQTTRQILIKTHIGNMFRLIL
jgi:hypothetical protein